MDFSVQQCAQEDCDRLLYIYIEPGDQSVFCGKCQGWTVFNVKKEGDDE